MTNSPGPMERSPSGVRIRNRPLRTRNISSSASWWCQTNSPVSFTSLTWESFTSPTIFGLQHSLNWASFDSRFTTSIAASRYA